MIRKIGFVVALVLMLSSGFAQEKDDLDSIREKAEQGDAEAQVILGQVLAPYGGEGVTADYQEAVTWFQKAAAQGHGRAQFRLGRAYYFGEGVPQDYQEAAKWFRKAAEQGVADAQFALGTMYKLGQGVAQDYQEAVKWYRKAAEQGYADAQYGLALMYANGEGVAQDYIQAHKWVNLAAAKLSGEKRERAVKLRNRIAEMLTREQVAEAQKMAGEWKPKKAGAVR